MNLEAGNYSLFFEKVDAWDPTCALEDNYYVGAQDVTRIAQHVTGYAPFEDINKLISADVAITNVMGTILIIVLVVSETKGWEFLWDSFIRISLYI